MIPRTHRFRFRFQDPEPGESGGGAVDRGDDFVPTDDDDDKVDDDAAAAALQKEIEDKAPDASKKPDDKDGDKPGTKDTRIPLARHKQILDNERAQREALERKLAQFEKGAVVADLGKEITAKEAKVLELEGKYAELLADGKVKEATAVMKELRGIEREITDAKADAKVQSAVAIATEQARYDTTLARIEGAYPVLDQDHPDYDEPTMKRVLKLFRANQADGMPPATALQDAVKFLLGDPQTAKQREAVNTKARVDPDVVQKTAEELAAERKTAEARKTADAVGKTPPNLKDAGKDSDKAGGGPLDAKQIMKLPYHEFAKLNEADLARARGDIL